MLAKKFIEAIDSNIWQKMSYYTIIQTIKVIN